MHLVVGLGNPGTKYAGHRHNVGFVVVDRLAQRLGAGAFREKFQGVFTKAEWGNHEAILLKPMTYMNLSGESVQKAMSFFKVDLKNVVVVHDELDVPFGQSRIKVSGGAAGHNGLRSIIEQCSGQDFVRVRVGISRPASGPVDGYVLSDFNSSERAELSDVVEKAADMAEAIVSKGTQVAMNQFNTRDKETKRAV
ncbi:MAG: aminoacyl-tRNA hydrolase [Sandaracinaceae bacterium]|nr:aminoacyl-tRNA hydrolase [Sandaracinaceae bacterium]